MGKVRKGKNLREKKEQKAYFNEVEVLRQVQIVEIFNKSWWISRCTYLNFYREFYNINRDIDSLREKFGTQ